MPTIVIAANRPYVSHETNLKDPLISTARLAQEFYDFHFITLSFASSSILSHADFSQLLFVFSAPVGCHWVLLPRTMAVLVRLI